MHVNLPYFAIEIYLLIWNKVHNVQLCKGFRDGGSSGTAYNNLIAVFRQILYAYRVLYFGHRK